MLLFSALLLTSKQFTYCNHHLAAMHLPSILLAAAFPLLPTSALAAPSFQLPFKIGSDGHAATITTRPGRGEVIDLQKYTIGQILNYTLYQHHREHHGDDDDDGHHEELARALEDHGHPHHPPLVKLSWIVNRTEAVSRLSFISVFSAMLNVIHLLLDTDQRIPLRS